MDAVTFAQAQHMAACAGRDPRAGARNRALVLVVYQHALLASEVSNLEWKDVDFDHNLLRVRRGHRAADSLHPMSPSVRAALWTLRGQGGGTGPVFAGPGGAPLGRLGTWRVIRDAADAAGIPGATAADLRASCAAHLAGAGWDARRIAAWYGFKEPKHARRLLRRLEAGEGA